MKKLLSLLFCFGIFFSLVGCGNKEEKEWIEVSKFAKQKVLEMYNCQAPLVYSLKMDNQSDKTKFKGNLNDKAKDFDDFRINGDITYKELLDADRVYYFYYLDSSIKEQREIMLLCKGSNILAYDYHENKAHELDIYIKAFDSVEGMNYVQADDELIQKMQ